MVGEFPRSRFDRPVSPGFRQTLRTEMARIKATERAETRRNRPKCNADGRARATLGRLRLLWLLTELGGPAGQLCAEPPEIFSLVGNRPCRCMIRGRWQRQRKVYQRTESSVLDGICGKVETLRQGSAKVERQKKDQRQYRTARHRETISSIVIRDRRSHGKLMVLLKTMCTCLINRKH